MKTEINHNPYNIAIALGNADKTKKIIDALNSRKNFPSALLREHVNWYLNQHLL